MLNLRGNPFYASVGVTSLAKIAEYSSFERFGTLAFGEECEIRVVKRLIKICPSEVSHLSYTEEQPPQWTPDLASYDSVKFQPR